MNKVGFLDPTLLATLALWEPKSVLLFYEKNMQHFCELLARDEVLLKSRSIITAENGEVNFRFTMACLIAEEMQSRASCDNMVAMHAGAPVRTHCFMDGKSQRCIRRPGDFIVIPPSFTPRRQGKEPAKVFHITWTPHFVQNVLGGAVPAIPTPEVQLRDPHLQGIAAALMTEHVAPSPLGRIYTESLMTAFVTRLANLQLRLPEIEPAVSRFSFRQESQLIEFIEANLASNLSLTKLAALTQCRLSRFKALFKSTFGCTPHQYVLNRRVARAQLLVIKGGLPLNEIALEAGFSHQSHMATAFRREFGCTPGQMRRSLVE